MRGRKRKEVGGMKEGGGGKRVKGGRLRGG